MNRTLIYTYQGIILAIDMKEPELTFLYFAASVDSKKEILIID